MLMNQEKYLSWKKKKKKKKKKADYLELWLFEGNASEILSLYQRTFLSRSIW